MARPVRPEVRYADMEARRYFNSQWADAKRHDFPPVSPGFDLIVKGKASLAPTAEDAGLERVGEYVHTVPLKQRRVVQVHYRDRRPTKVKAHLLEMTEHQFKYLRGMFLTGLAGYLLGR